VCGSPPLQVLALVLVELASHVLLADRDVQPVVQTLAPFVACVAFLVTATPRELPPAPHFDGNDDDATEDVVGAGEPKTPERLRSPVNSPVTPASPATGAHVASLVASKGDGRGNELTQEQIALVKRLHDHLASEYAAEWEGCGIAAPMLAFLSLETCRRYLVARQWNWKKAAAQLRGTLEWRAETQVWTKRFCNSPGCVDNPMAMCMRVVGVDDAGRPVIYTTFLQAPDRWNNDHVQEHMMRLLESAHGVICKQMQRHAGVEASAAQWVWVIDFLGMTMRDVRRCCFAPTNHERRRGAANKQNPLSALYVARLMAHYPELLHCTFLVDAPFIFSLCVWRAARTATGLTRGFQRVEHASKRAGRSRAPKGVLHDAQVSQRQAHRHHRRPHDALDRARNGSQPAAGQRAQGILGRAHDARGARFERRRWLPRRQGPLVRALPRAPS